MPVLVFFFFIRLRHGFVPFGIDTVVISYVSVARVSSGAEGVRAWSDVSRRGEEASQFRFSWPLSRPRLCHTLTAERCFREHGERGLALLLQPRHIDLDRA